MPAEPIPSLWSAAAPQDVVDRLVYASNLLGSDPRITNFGGGNTSVKTEMPDPIDGRPTRVLWVKGSGGDLGTATRAGFASLDLDRVLSLEEKLRQAGLDEDAAVGLYPHCVFGLNPTPCSIDTPLHAFVPAAAVSHMHSDAVIAVAAAEGAQRLCEEVWEGQMGFLPWKRPGFDLGLMLRDLIEEKPGTKGALMASHGFICWADDWQECYELTLRLINRAAEHLERIGSAQAFGPVVRERSANAEWREFLPRLRGAAAYGGRRLVAQVDRSEVVLDFLAREKAEPLAWLGTSCPDHFLRTKIRPLFLADPAQLDSALAGFRQEYAAYYDRCRRPDSPPMRNPNPSVVLIPGWGMVSLGKNPKEALVTGQFYRNAIEVMRGAETLSRYVALPEQEAFDIEYWALEEAKLRRLPADREFAGQVAVITGGAQGIGRATALRLAERGACVVLLDIDEERLGDAVREANKAAGSDLEVRGVRCDVTDEAAMTAAFDEAVFTFGGVDILVACAGNARRGTVAETSDSDYDFQAALLMRAYFSAMRQASRIMIEQGTGGSIVVVASKNGVAAGQNAAVYSAAKAFELHLMRCTAADLARHGIRCNAINPDAVLEGSGIWNDRWRAETAAMLGIEPDQLQEHYRKRTLLGLDVRADDCAEAVCWLAGSASSRTTGATLPVDGGVREGFLR
ncbi:MAG TPA: bifunctional rhamnulose-1-phosphate aldolase/short-chain dehydrogenase [Fimbriimonadaceae bacterium]|nr:bifunctional rhamnulose-1-phosphate aldolase/short-chain dehydrogenase [Fimbriimonadaceae bacterium]HRJ96431.1 bifunctional rhamnulose-1-phosphate aldolase/short-chain dehydrogenase [Fimbriimonadaceae bacterium]